MHADRHRFQFQFYFHCQRQHDTNESKVYYLIPRKYSIVDQSSWSKVDSDAANGSVAHQFIGGLF